MKQIKTRLLWPALAVAISALSIQAQAQTSAAERDRGVPGVNVDVGKNASDKGLPGVEANVGKDGDQKNLDVNVGNARNDRDVSVDTRASGAAGSMDTTTRSARADRN